MPGQGPGEVALRVPGSKSLSATVATDRRTDVSGYTEEAFFFGPAAQSMFGCLHLPRTAPRAGIVICSPLLGELQRTYRLEVLLARRLAERGFAVQRFQYRGSGNSDGDFVDSTFDTMRADTEAAVDELRKRVPVNTVAFIGIRWGGLLAASCAASSAGSPLALWEPVLDGGKYFRELLRWRLMRDLKEGKTSGSSEGDLEDELHRSGHVDVLGQRVTRALQLSAAGRRLETELGPIPRSVLLVEINRSQQLSPGYAALTEQWSSLGFEVEVVRVQDQVPWWFQSGHWEAEETRDRTRTLLGRTTDWIAAQLGAGSDRQ
jgi:exosortase A-associated hydrolase 2